jgi:hypothetical protein
MTSEDSKACQDILIAVKNFRFNEVGVEAANA